MSETLYGFDSGLTAFGYAVAEGTPGQRARFKAVGVLTTKPTPKTGPVKLRPSKTADHQRRFEFLAGELRDLIARHGVPSIIATEAVAIPRGKTALITVSALGRARGLVDGLCAEHRVVAREVWSQTIKRVVAGDVSADKAAVIAAVKGLYPELHELFAQLSPGVIEHAADAVAALHVALTRHHQEQDHAEANEAAE